MGKDVIRIDHKLVRNLNAAWARRATVCQMDKFSIVAGFDAAKPDYPLSLVPFRDHPVFLSLDPQCKQSVLTLAWLGYNKRTIMAEDLIVNPAFFLIAESNLLGDDSIHFKEAMRQALVDEHYHTLMHLGAIQRTVRNRAVPAIGEFPPSVTFTTLQRILSEENDREQRSVTKMCFAIVAEISVNAFLDLLADDSTIQEQNSLVAKHHNRDEYAHGKILAEVAKMVYGNMSASQREVFVETLPIALRAFVAQDYTMWRFILETLNVSGAGEMLSDCSGLETNRALVRDYSGLSKLAEELGIVDRIDFDFTGFR